ncbi:general secretion pathway protein C [Xanthomonas campestris]|uniref:type II secretion system protein N n=1 Tax=Xanthomonas campestris TaxID=339 RepID=UPI002B235E29|nr:type II secretion system protein N [Xanthomonas campestris]MEA9712721.1 type II secretion system protein N [Xanthomonas campestris]MEA9794971.1 type II secretion system protein N [Xanthomonas campestris pv. raphani]MEC5193694.1 general secretion pathway protein C [Xanthomonas campestris]
MSALQRVSPSLNDLMSARAVRTAAVCVLLVLLAVQGVRLVWLLVTPLGPLGTAQGATTAAPLPALQRDVFFRAPADSGDLGLVLHGVRVGGADSAAYLSTGDGRQGAYRIGDAVAPGLTLQAIAADHVMVRAGSALRRLPLIEQAVASAAIRAPLPASGDPAAAAAVASNVGARTAAAGTTAVDPQQLLRTTGLRANADGGGFTVMPRGDDALLRQAGLAPGDVLTQLNGRTLDAEHLRELQDELRDGQTATLTYRRDGQTHTMTLKRPQ